VFIAQFFNTGFVLLLANANLEETHIPFLNKVVRSIYTDFSDPWYKDVGATIIKTMMIGAVMPVVEFCMMYSLRYGFRMMDRSFKKDDTKSKKKSI
jgi:hypothetical protein